MKIPFYAPWPLDGDTLFPASCLQRPVTDGPCSAKALKQLSRIYGHSRMMLTSSCSAALETALALCGLAPGDQVLLPSYNFPSAANAVLRAGGTPVFCDIDPDTQNLSPLDAASKITGRTRAIIPVHYAGVSCAMDEVLKLARDARLTVVEDAAQAMGSLYKDRPLGAVGDWGCVSFHHTKNLTCGEGGLLVCKSREAYEEARCYRVHGTNRDAFLHGECDRYTWVMAGSSTALGEPCAAVLSLQLPWLEDITAIRTSRVKDYFTVLNPLEKAGYARLMAIPSYACPNGHIFYLRFASEALRDRIHKLLLKNGVEAKTHYVPLHLSPMGQKLGYRPGDCPESAACCHTLLRLPLHTQLTFGHIEQIGEIITKGCTSS